MSVRQPEDATGYTVGADELRGESWWSGCDPDVVGDGCRVLHGCAAGEHHISGGHIWWGQGDSNLGFFGFESVVDGTSNTGLFSEKLLGWAIANSAPLYANSPEGRRGIYTNAAISTAYNSLSLPLALSSLQACQAIPSTSLNNSGWLNGFSWALGYEWYTVVNSYHHYNTPNKWTCINPGDAGAHWGGTAGMSTASSNHSGGVNVCFADGSVHFIKDSIGPQTWFALGSRNGAEVISSDQY